MKATLPALLLLASQAHADGNVYRVLIDGRIQATASMRLSDGHTHGQIYYDSSGADGLELSGDAQPGRFEWREGLWTRDASDSRPTGTFSGKFSADGKSGQGAWKSADGKKNLSLSLAHLAKIEAQQAPDVEASVDYPQFDDPRYAKLNAQLRSVAKQELAGHVKSIKDMRAELKDEPPETLERLTSTTSCDVESATGNTVSLLCSAFEFSGGAHGNTALEGRNYVLGTDGKPRPLKLWDVLQKSPANAAKLSSLILADLKRQKASSVLDGSIKDFTKELEKNALEFTVVPAGLAFHFSPYALGSYAEGHFRAVIPSRAIAALYRPDGPLAARANKP